MLITIPINLIEADCQAKKCDSFNIKNNGFIEYEIEIRKYRDDTPCGY